MPPISVKKLEAFLPHRPPMIWVDEVLWTTPEAGCCRLTINPQAPYWGPQGLLQCAPIEWMAQACGYSAAARLFEAGSRQGLKETFLVGMREAWLAEPSQVQPGMEVEIEVRLIKDLPPLSLVSGQVRAGGVLIAQATLKLFGR